MAGHAPAQAGRIGPNAITRMAEALELIAGPVARDRVFVLARLEPYLATPPAAMVPDDEVARLHAIVFAEFGIDRARAIGEEAGRRTGAYLLAHRIPAIARFILPLLPARLALHILLRAVERHAWTFAGRGLFSWKPSREGFELRLENNPVSRDIQAPEPVCDYYRATFETLFRALAGPRLAVEETACTARGEPCCIFVVRL